MCRFAFTVILEPDGAVWDAGVEACLFFDAAGVFANDIVATVNSSTAANSVLILVI